MRNIDEFFSSNIVKKVRLISLSIRLHLSTLFLMPFSIFTIAPRPVHCDLFDEQRRPQSSSYEQKTSSVQQIVTFVHTFETPEQCGMICPRPCIMRVMEELEMMQRWICDSSSRFEKDALPSRSGGSLRANFLVEKEGGNNLMSLLNNQFLLVIVPFTLMLILCLIILIRRCNSKSSAV